MGVDVDFDRSIHANDTESSDDLRAVGHLLRSQKQLWRVLIPVVVEALETLGREADRGCGGEVEISAVEEVEERVL